MRVLGLLLGLLLPLAADAAPEARGQSLLLPGAAPIDAGAGYAGGTAGALLANPPDRYESTINPDYSEGEGWLIQGGGAVEAGWAPTARLELDGMAFLLDGAGIYALNARYALVDRERLRLHPYLVAGGGWGGIGGFAAPGLAAAGGGAIAWDASVAVGALYWTADHVSAGLEGVIPEAGVTWRYAPDQSLRLGLLTLLPNLTWRLEGERAYAAITLGSLPPGLPGLGAASAGARF